MGHTAQQENLAMCSAGHDAICSIMHHAQSTYEVLESCFIPSSPVHQKESRECICKASEVQLYCAKMSLLSGMCRLFGFLSAKRCLIASPGLHSFLLTSVIR